MTYSSYGASLAATDINEDTSYAKECESCDYGWYEINDANDEAWVEDGAYFCAVCFSKGEHKK